MHFSVAHEVKAGFKNLIFEELASKEIKKKKKKKKKKKTDPFFKSRKRSNLKRLKYQGTNLLISSLGNPSDA